MKRRAIDVEMLFRTDLETLWERTQDPGLHHRWDLRFSSVQALSTPPDGGPPRFAYLTRLPFGITLRSEGEVAGRKEGPEGSRTVALTLRSDDPRMLIARASGHWKYEPGPDGVRFKSHYQYDTRYGLLGVWVDGVLLRPFLRWATHWSFDRLRLWIEKGISPETSLRVSLAHLLARSTVGLLWIYHGLIPKLLFPEAGELRLAHASGLFPGHEGTAVRVIGVLEIVLGLLILGWWRSRAVLLAGLLPAALLTAGGIATDPDILKGPFNVVSLSVPLVVLSILSATLGRDLPSGVSRPERADESRESSSPPR